jgi:hypothetical protein
MEPNGDFYRCRLRPVPAAALKPCP